MRGRVLSVVAAALVAGCGDDAVAPDYSLRTPPPVVGAPALPGAGNPTLTRDKPRKLTARDARRLRPVIARWARAVQRGDAKAASRLFRLPAVVGQGALREITTQAELEQFNAGFPCGARLLRVRAEERFLVGTFRLVARPGATCPDVGQTVRVAFGFRGRRFSEWYQVG